MYCSTQKLLDPMFTTKVSAHALHSAPCLKINVPQNMQSDTTLRSATHRNKQVDNRRSEEHTEERNQQLQGVSSQGIQIQEGFHITSIAYTASFIFNWRFWILIIETMLRDVDLMGKKLVTAYELAKNSNNSAYYLIIKL